MSQPEVAHLCDIGPLLLDMSGRPFEDLVSLHDLLDVSLLGWLGSPVPAQHLANHLGDALACQDANGASLLIRSYISPALPLLHQRSDLPLHGWLFGPVDTWWARTDPSWQRFAGLSQREIAEYHPIRLDEALMRDLQHDARAEQLLQQVGHVAPESFSSDCHGERLKQVQRLLVVAGEQKLAQADDQAFFVLYSLMSKTSLHDRPDWPDILRRVHHEHATLERLLAAEEGI
ncbi:hypothetical protein NA647_17855 [Pseudomonas stutzeri]|uniref:DUF4123 domain-containing protein n=1 Tax=Stutzerimonas stutzeri TaxID=316 RepID=UPI00210BDF76|nr:DUF4123 domain-containing protein [Stutzerimonas stutzeri]MCQ4289288.1 hypothetical protein [Stutzerimonas stutzeri]